MARHSLPLVKCNKGSKCVVKMDRLWPFSVKEIFQNDLLENKITRSPSQSLIMRAKWRKKRIHRIKGKGRKMHACSKQTGCDCLASFPFPTMKFYMLRYHEVNLFNQSFHCNIPVLVVSHFGFRPCVATKNTFKLKKKSKIKYYGTSVIQWGFDFRTCSDFG